MTILTLTETPFGRGIMLAMTMYVHSVVHLLRGHPHTITQNRMVAVDDIALKAATSTGQDADSADVSRAVTDSHDNLLVVEHNREPITALVSEVSKNTINLCEYLVETC
jgi:hypothetical protein